MRILLVIVLAIVAIGAAGVWALGEYGHVFSGGQSAAREPLVIEPEIVAANDQPAAPAPNSAPTLRSQPAPSPEAAAEPKPAAPPVQETTATPEPQAAPAPGAAETASAPPPPAAARSSSVLAEKFDEAAAARSAAPPAPPPPAPTAELQVSVPAAAPEQAAQAVQVAAASAAAPAAAPAAGLESQFKSRKVTYNRPPEKLALNKAIDVSLVINATEDANAGRDALQGFPGEVVERDVDLSNIVSAQLTGIGFDITSQTVERQKLSGRAVNRWQWRVTPTEVGTRTLKLDIFGYEFGGPLDAEPLAAYSDTIVVEVQQGVDQIINWARGVQPAFAVLAALAAAASALLGFLRFREDRKKNRHAA